MFEGNKTGEIEQFKKLTEAVEQAADLSDLKARLAEINGHEQTDLELRLSAHSPVIGEDDPGVVEAIQGYQTALAHKLDQFGVSETDTLIPEENKN